MAKKKAPQGTPAIVALQEAGITHRLHPYESPGSPGKQSGQGHHHYGIEAAEALGVEPGRLFKTLLADVDGVGLAVAVVPVAGSLDLKAFASALGGKKATMADPAAAERATGYVVGGISPLGQRRRLPTVLDESATTFDSIYVSAGRRGLQVELAPSGLATLTAATLAPISRR